jgi:hypothetical protein
MASLLQEDRQSKQAASSRFLARVFSCVCIWICAWILGAHIGKHKPKNQQEVTPTKAYTQTKKTTEHITTRSTSNFKT